MSAVSSASLSSSSSASSSDASIVVELDHVNIYNCDGLKLTARVIDVGGTVYHLWEGPLPPPLQADADEEEHPPLVDLDEEKTEADRLVAVVEVV